MFYEGYRVMALSYTLSLFIQEGNKMIILIILFIIVIIIGLMMIYEMGYEKGKQDMHKIIFKKHDDW